MVARECLAGSDRQWVQWPGRHGRIRPSRNSSAIVKV
jgi:hypothetical protein